MTPFNITHQVTLKRTVFSLLAAAAMAASASAELSFPAPQPADSATVMQTLARITPGKYRGATAVIAFDRQREQYTATGTSVLERTVLVKALTDLGVRDWAQVRLSYAPQYNRAEFLWARLIKSNGGIVPLRVDSLEDVPQPPALGGTIFWGERDRVLTVPGMERGDAVEYATRELGGLWQGPGSLRDSLALLGRLAAPYRGQFNRMVMLQSEQPVLEISYTVTGPNALPLKFATYNGTVQHSVTADSSITTHTWTARDVPAIVREPMMPSDYDVGLKLIVTTIPSWEWMSRFEYAQADSCLQPDQTIRDQAAELTAGRDDYRARIRALFYYVARSVRYLGLAVGDAEGYQPHPARMTLQQRAGVCKDKAGLLVSLLNAAGFRAWYTTTAAGSRIEDIPADQANHAIVAIADGRGGTIYCDPTMADESLEILPAHERGQQVLIAKPEGDKLRQIPQLPADSNRLEAANECVVDTAGAVSGTLTIRGWGSQDSGLRRAFGWHSRSEWDAIAQDIVRQIGPAAAVTEFTHTDPDSVWQPMVLTIRYQIPGAVVRVGRYRMLRPCLSQYEPWWTDPSRAIALPQRQYPLDLRVTQRVSLSERMTLPPGWRVAALPPSGKGTFKQGAWRVAASLENEALVYSRDMLVSDPAVPAADYQRLRRSLLEYLDARQAWIVLQAE